MKTLVVDDSQVMRSMLTGYLEELEETRGSEVHQAADGQEALEKVNRSGPFELILVDWNMPVMDGAELVQQVRSNPIQNKCKIIMVTTENTSDALSRAFAVGVDDFLMKPISEKEIVFEKLRGQGLID